MVGNFCCQQERRPTRPPVPRALGLQRSTGHQTCPGASLACAVTLHIDHPFLFVVAFAKLGSVNQHT